MKINIEGTKTQVPLAVSLYWYGLNAFSLPSAIIYWIKWRWFAPKCRFPLRLVWGAANAACSGSRVMNGVIEEGYKRLRKAEPLGLDTLDGKSEEDQKIILEGRNAKMVIWMIGTMRNWKRMGAQRS